jgi:hypothetical protein
VIAANDQQSELAILRDRYGAEPRALEDVVLLAPVAQVEERRAEFPGIDVQPLLFSSAELQAAHWSFLLGAVGNQAMYIRQLKQIFRANRTSLTLDAIRRGIGASTMADNMKDLASQRLDLAADYIDDSVRISDYVRPGRLIIVDLRDEYIEEDESLGLFVVLMQLFAESPDSAGRFNKLVVFDEAHKYIDSPELVEVLVESVREMRHKGMSILVASQDPPSVPTSLIELSDVIIVHKMTSPAWLKHIQKANSALMALRPEQLARLQPGEAYVWAGKSSESSITHSAVRMTGGPHSLHAGPRTTRRTGTRGLPVLTMPFDGDFVYALRRAYRVLETTLRTLPRPGHPKNMVGPWETAVAAELYDQRTTPVAQLARWLLEAQPGLVDVVTAPRASAPAPGASRRALLVPVPQMVA